VEGDQLRHGDRSVTGLAQVTALDGGGWRPGVNGFGERERGNLINPARLAQSVVELGQRAGQDRVEPVRVPLVEVLPGERQPPMALAALAAMIREIRGQHQTS
jgi:hypothetical protein